jgi:hypothetical protein
LFGVENKDIKTQMIDTEKRLKESETDCAHLNVALEGRYIFNARYRYNLFRLEGGSPVVLCYALHTQYPDGICLH